MPDAALSVKTVSIEPGGHLVRALADIAPTAPITPGRDERRARRHREAGRVRYGLDLALLWLLERFGPDDDEDWGS